MDVSRGREQATTDETGNETLGLPGLFVDVRVSCDMVEGNGIECEQSLVPLDARVERIGATGRIQKSTHRTDPLYPDAPSILFGDSLVSLGGKRRTVGKTVNEARDRQDTTWFTPKSASCWNERGLGVVMHTTSITDSASVR